MLQTITKTPHDVRALRSTFGQFATGVTVVSYEFDGHRFGATVNSFTSVSMDPALVLVSFDRASRSAMRLAGRPFAVNVLSQEQHETALHFAGKQQDGHGIRWDDQGVAPRLADSLAWFTCTPWQNYDGGDHVLLVGEIDDFAVASDQDPLVFFRGRFGSVPI